MAYAFVAEVRRDLERATAAGTDLPARIRTMHARAGHATPEYRTLAIPVQGVGTEVLSALIAGYAHKKPPCCMLFAMDALAPGDEGERQPILIAEARDDEGTRMFFMQTYQVRNSKAVWGEPMHGGWQDPGDQELILDASFDAESLAPLPMKIGEGTVEPPPAGIAG